MNGLQDWREWREMVDRSLTRLADVALDQTGVLRKLLERVEALERRTEPEELIKVVMSAPMTAVSVTEQPVNVINFNDIDPVPQMYNARYEPTGDSEGNCDACKRRNMMMFFVDPGPCPVCGANYGSVGRIDLPMTKKEWVDLDADVAARVQDRIAQALEADGFWKEDAPTIVESSP